MKLPLQICLLLFLPVVVLAAERTPEEALREAERLRKDGRLAKAREIYEGFLAEHPDHLRAFDVEYRLAIIADHKGNPDDAIERLGKLLARSKKRGAGFKHRAEAFLHLGKLQASLNRHEEAVKTFTAFLGEGAGLYEDEAYNLCAGHHAILGNFEQAASMFNILKHRPQSRFAKEAGYKLAVVWLKAGKSDLATAAVEEFARANPGHPRTPELFLKVARHYYEAGEFRKAAAVCEQIRARFAKSPESAKAVYLTALCSKSSRQFDRAVASLLDLARLYAGRDRELAMEAVFEAAQIEHKELKNTGRAMELYAKAAAAAKDMKSLRQRQVREYCYFRMAEHEFREGHWQAALDRYLQLRKVNPELDVNARVMQCKSKLSESGTVSLAGGSKAEREFIEEKIKTSPGTLVAARGEVYLADLELRRATGGKRRGTDWKAIDEALERFRRVLAGYPPELLDGDGLRAYIFNRMGYANGLAAADTESPPADAAKRVKEAISLYEKGLALAGDSPCRIEMLENLARLSHHAGDRRKAFDTYRTLYEITSREEAGEEEIDPFDYLKSMSTLAASEGMIDEVAAILEENLRTAPKSSPVARDSMFHLADLYFLKKRYSQAAKVYRAFLKTHGPGQDENGEAPGHLVRPDKVDETVERLYDAGVRIAHCWLMQGNEAEMLKAYAWITRNQPHRNRHLPEAWYYTAAAMPENDAAAKEEKARTLWVQLVNPSTDFGSKAYREKFKPWIDAKEGVIDERAGRYVRTGMLRAGELYSELKRHETAAEVFSQYLELAGGTKTGSGKSAGPPEHDDDYRTARYALGRELAALGDYDRLAEVFRAYLDGGRDDRFRVSGLMMLGHYATRAELWEDASDAYAALLDEYGPPNPTGDDGKPVPVPVAERLRPKSNWNGIRLEGPPDLDRGAVRFALGYMHWQKADWAGCAKTLAPFAHSAVLAENKSRDQALLMLGRSWQKLGDHSKAIAALQALRRGYPSFRGAEEAAVDLVRSCCEAADWKALARAYDDFVKRHPKSDRRPYLDLYDALGKLAAGEPRAGASKLRDLAGANTYEDVKADARFHLARLLLAESPPKPKEAMAELVESVKLFPRAASVFEAGRCAAMLEDYERARAFFNQVLREFPDAEPAILNRAREELRAAAKAAAKG